MAEEIKIDKATFFARTKSVLERWNSPNLPERETLSGVDSVLVFMGGVNPDVVFSKTSALHTWLLGYEFPSTLLLITREGLTFVTSTSKAKILEPLLTPEDGVKVDVFKRSKNDEENLEIWKKLIDKMAGTGKRVGVFSKDKPIGKVADEWKKIWDEERKARNLEEIDVSAPFGGLFAVKDEEEIKLTRMAAKLSSGVLSRYLTDEMMTILDEGRKVSHEKLAGKVESQLENDALWKKMKGIDGVDMGLADWCYTPIIQSGGEYSLKLSASSNAERLEGADGGGVIMASLGMKYKNYCANIGRTWIVDPDKTQAKYFGILLDLQNEICDNYLKAGVTCREVAEKAAEFVQSKDRDGVLADKFTRSIGFAIGIEFRDSGFLLQAKNERVIEKDMTFNVQVGFENLDDPKHKGRKYSLMLADTVRVREDGADFLSDKLRKLSDNMFYNEEDSDEEDKRASKAKEPANVTAGGKVLRSKGRGKVEASVTEKIREHQKELAILRQEDGLERNAKEDGKGSKGDQKKFKPFELYKKEPIPDKAKDLKIFVDNRAHAVVLPIYGFAVPYHISTIKNVSKSDEGDFSYLRFNFITPGQIAGRKEDVPFENPDATFIRSMSFRSSDASHVNELFKAITEMKKAENKAVAAKAEMADVETQEPLVLSKGRTATLMDVFPRPALEGKRVPGNVTIHETGIRYEGRDGRQIDVLFESMKHLFWQSSEGELIVLIHIHLKSPIMIGKRKTKDIQFYREASNVAFDETGNRKRKYRAGDEDEIELEQEERRLRRQLDKEFKSFAQKIADASDGRVTVDAPYRELGFNGVPARSSVLMAPTEYCLVHLTEPPFVVITIEEVDICHLERVSLQAQSSGSFDAVFVFKDLNTPPLTIRSIPLGSLDYVREWLDSVDVLISSGPVNLNWGAIIKQIKDDPYGFYTDGGWSFLQEGGSDDEDSDESDDESDFSKEVSATEMYEDESDDDASGSDFDEDSDDDGSEAEELSDSGDDWDEMERKAAKADKKRGGSDDEGGGGGKSRGGRR